MMETSHSIIIFDSVCNLCNWAVRFIIRRDVHSRFRFVACQIETGRKLLEQHGIAFGNAETLVLIENGRYYTGSTAVLKITRRLSGLWPLFHVFIIIPTWFRDFLYHLVARNRYRIFGRRENCSMPTGINERFIQ